MSRHLPWGRALARAAAALAAALLLFASTSTARAEDDPQALLDEAAQAIDDVDFEAARGHAARALATGRLTPGQLARAHRLAGETAADGSDGDLTEAETEAEPEATEAAEETGVDGDSEESAEAVEEETAETETEAAPPFYAGIVIDPPQVPVPSIQNLLSGTS